MAARLNSIQYLRAIAALAVVGLHAVQMVSPQLSNSVFAVLKLGHAGVDLFFVISGFVIWRMCQNANGSELSPITFLRRRAFRILPIYWLATLLWVILHAATGSGWIALDFSHILQSFFLWPHYHPLHPDRIWPVLILGWTLCFELLFYTGVALTLVLTKAIRTIAISAAIPTLVLLGMVFDQLSPAWFRTLTSPLLLEFLAGCLIAELFQRHKLAPQVGWLFVTFGVGVLLAFGTHIEPYDHWQRVTGYGAPVAAIMWGAIVLDSGRFHSPLLGRLGDSSYVIYLSHVFVLFPLASIWRFAGPWHTPVAALGFTCLAVVLAAAFGLICHKHIECRLLSWRISRPFSLRKRGVSANG